MRSASGLQLLPCATPAVTTLVVPAQHLCQHTQPDSPTARQPAPHLTPPHPTPAGARVTKKVEAVLGGFDQAAYSTERLWATAHDGTQVPISLVYRWGGGVCWCGSSGRECGMICRPTLVQLARLAWGVSTASTVTVPSHIYSTQRRGKRSSHCHTYSQYLFPPSSTESTTLQPPSPSFLLTTSSPYLPTGRAPPVTAAPRCCWTATAPTRSPTTRGSARTG